MVAKLLVTLTEIKTVVPSCTHGRCILHCHILEREGESQYQKYDKARKFFDFIILTPKYLNMRVFSHLKEKCLYSCWKCSWLLFS